MFYYYAVDACFVEQIFSASENFVLAKNEASFLKNKLLWTDEYKCWFLQIVLKFDENFEVV